MDAEKDGTHAFGGGGRGAELERRVFVVCFEHAVAVAVAVGVQAGWDS